MLFPDKQYLQRAWGILALGLLVVVLLAYMLIAALAVSYIVVELAGVLAVPTIAIVGASLATSGLLATLLLKSRTDHRLVPASGIAVLMDNRLLAASVAVGAGLSVAAILFPS